MSCHHTVMIRWIAATGAFVVSLDSMVNIAFPSMAASFGVPPESMRWVIVCYVFTYSLVSFMGGGVGDRIGHARVFSAGAGLSALAFLVTARAPTFGWLLVGRVVQGLAGGLVYGTAPGIITLASAPSDRGRALGFLNASIGVAFATGPVIAGGLIDAVGWRSVFAVRIPLALAVLAWSLFGLPVTRRATAHRSARVSDFTRADVLRACAASFLANGGIFAIWLLAPFYLVNRRGLDALAAGFMFMLAPLGTTLASPLGGALADRIGPRRPVVAGLAIEVVGLILMSAARETTPGLVVGSALFIAGFGLGLFQPPNMATVMEAFPARQQGVAGGLSFMARTLGVVAGVATLAQIFAVRRASAGFDAAFTTAFVVAAAAVTIAALGASLPDRRRAARPSASADCS
jgi:DHA2 family methylenomycin A resistance protein-like MFS transporter